VANNIMNEAFRNVVSYTNRACTGLRSGTIDIAMIVPDMALPKGRTRRTPRRKFPGKPLGRPTVLTHGLDGRRIVTDESG